MDFEDLKPKKTQVFSIGDDLDKFSVEELSQLMQSLKVEISRVKKEKDKKELSKKKAEDIFGG